MAGVLGRRILPVSLMGGVVLPVGFALNGSTNTTLKAMISLVKNSTGRGVWAVQGDSTTAGEGGGTGTKNLTAARQNRPSSIVSSLLSGAGVKCNDLGVCGDQGVSYATVSLPTYDPRTSWTAAALVGQGNTFAGGTTLNASASGQGITLTETCNRFDITFFNAGGNVTITIDNIAPDVGVTSYAIPNTGSGFTKITVGSTITASHTLKIVCSNSLNIQSCVPYTTTVSAIDVVCQAFEGAYSASMAAVNGSAWACNNYTSFLAPSFTTINIGLNDMNAGVTTATYTTNLQTVITAAKASGDVLVIFPTPASGAYNTNVTNFNAAAKSVASSNNVAFFSLWEYYGPFTTAFGTRLYDGIVHPNAALYAEIGGLIRDCMKIMNGGAF